MAAVNEGDSRRVSPEAGHSADDLRELRTRRGVPAAPKLLKGMVALGFDPAGAPRGAAAEEPWQIRATPRQIRLLVDLLHNCDAPKELRDTARLELLYALGMAE